MIYCFYHAVDLDGQCSGAIVNHYYKKMGVDIEIVPFNYHYKLPFEKFTKEDLVYFVDVAPSPYEELLRLKELVNKVIVFDHHQTFINSQVGKIFSNDEKSHLEIGIAGCEITWKKLFPNTPMPLCVLLLGKYDSWRNQNKEEWDNIILPFQYGMRLEKTDPDKNYDFWYIWLTALLENSHVEAVVKNGALILAYENQQNERLLHQSFDYQLTHDSAVYNCLCVNSTSRNSQTFKSKWNIEKYDFMVAYSQLKTGQWSFSMYTDKPGRDASAIAKSFGGGGHVGAAGFTIDELNQFFIFKLDTSLVKLLGEKERAEVVSYLKGLSNDELVECLTKYKDMPTCFSLAVQEAKDRLR
jgi:oligoribonuclease NrnB/cAMP/cGMP phosphodiesterase (DHH superfamily)